MSRNLKEEIKECIYLPHAHWMCIPHFILQTLVCVVTRYKNETQL